MEDVKNDFEQQQNLTDKDIFSKIWTSPRKVFRHINDNNYDKYVKTLLVFLGISSAFDGATMTDMADSMSIWAILGVCIIIGGLLGWIYYYIYAVLINWSGKWLNAQGNTNSILRIISYAMIPSILALLCLIPQIGIYGDEVFISDGELTSENLFLDILGFGFILLELALGICTIIFLVIGISEVQKLSILQTILNLILPTLMLIVPIYIIVLLFFSF